MSSGLAIVEKRPPFPGGGCAGGVLFHLLDWHRRLARKRRLFSPRRLLPSSLRASPRRLPCPPPSPMLPPPPPPPAAAPRPAAATADGAAPGVVARLMGLESWPTGAAPPPRPQKQRKVEAPAPEPAWRPDDDGSAVVLVLPTTRRIPPAPVSVPAPTARSHHGADLPARSPRRGKPAHEAAAKLLEPGARASARLAVAYACSSPQHRRDGRSGATLQGSSGVVADDFLSRSESLSLEHSRRRVQVQHLPVPLAEEADRDSASASRRHERQRSINSVSVDIGVSTVVLPRMDFGDGSISKHSSGADVKHKEHRVRTEVMQTCARVRSSSAAVQTGNERLLRKRATPTHPEVQGIVGSGGSAGSTKRQVGRARELESAGRRVAQSGSGPRREFRHPITGQGNATRRDVNNRSGLASTSRISSNGAGPKRGPRKKVALDAAASNREDRNAVAFASRSSAKPVARASSCSNASKSGCPSRRGAATTCARMPAADTKCMEASPVMATYETDEFSRLLKAKINELGMSDRIEFASSDAPSGKLTAPVLQELISALTNDMNTATSQCSNSDVSAPSSNANGGHVDQSGYDRSPDFQKCYQGEQDVDSSVNNEPNQPSPTSVLEACYSNDTSSLGSPSEKNEVKDLSVSIENKMEDLFNLESDFVDLAMSVGTRETGAEVKPHDNDKFLESRLKSIEEAISNAELLLSSSPKDSTAAGFALHPFILEMLENTMDMFGREDSSDLTEDKKYQRTNFLFDCIIESLDSKFCNFGKCGYKAWLKLPLSLSKDVLKCQILEDISDWGESCGTALSGLADKEVDQLTRWDAGQVEAFGISNAIEDDILEALVGEFAVDLW